jgi:hypothetical protein
MDLGREPYQIEVDELVEKEIAAVMLKNKDRKKRKGKEVAQPSTTPSSNDVEERLLLLEDFVEKWEEKLEVWGRMLSRMYASQFKNQDSQVAGDHVSEAELSEGRQSKVSVHSEDSGEVKGSIKSYTDDGSEESNNSEDEGDHLAGKSMVMPVDGKKKRTPAIEEDDMGDTAVGHSEAELSAKNRVRGHTFIGIGPYVATVIPRSCHLCRREEKLDIDDSIGGYAPAV